MAKSKDLRIYFAISEIRVCYIRKILEGCVICCISVRAKRVLGISVSALERFFAEQASIECVVTGGVIGRPQFVQLGFNSFFLFPNPSLTIQLRRINFLRSLKATLPRTCKINCYAPQVAWLHVRLVNIGSTMLVTSGQCWQTAWPMECFLSIGGTQAKRVEHILVHRIGPSFTERVGLTMAKRVEPMRSSIANNAGHTLAQHNYEWACVGPLCVTNIFPKNNADSKEICSLGCSRTSVIGFNVLVFIPISQWLDIEPWI